MSYLLHIVGFIIGTALFLYLLSMYEGIKERRKGSRRPVKAGEPMHIEPESIFHKRWRKAPGERICPLCGSTLTQFEALYASPLKDSRGTKILILGCRHCYKAGDENRIKNEVK